MSHYTKEHLGDALTWIERNTPGGIALVARALSETYPEANDPDVGPLPCDTVEGAEKCEECSPELVQHIATVKADEINAQFPGTEAVVLTIDGEVMRVGANVDGSSVERVKEILSRALDLLTK